MRPVEGVEGRAPEVVHAGKPGQGRNRQQSEHRHQEPAGEGAPVRHPNPPEVRGLVVVRRVDPAVELHVAPEVELVRDEVEIAQVLGLAREVLLPVPLVEHFPRERVAVGVALRIEARAGVAVVVPGAAEVGVRLEDRGVHPEVGEALDLVDAGHPGPDHDDFEVRLAHHFLPAARPVPFSSDRGPGSCPAPRRGGMNAGAPCPARPMITGRGSRTTPRACRGVRRGGREPPREAPPRRPG